MPPIRAITVCVNYDDLLQITLPSVLPHVEEMIVVTAPNDTRTLDYLHGFDRVRPFVTDAFYRGGAKFNKGLAMEEGFSFMQRRGWILVLDADIVLPPGVSEVFRVNPPKIGRLYTPYRRILDDPKAWVSYINTEKWKTLPGRKEDRAHYGYFQLFHADDPALRNRPWYPICWTHAGRCDDEFQHRWPSDHKERPDFEVLHLGKCDENWFGRATDRIDGIPADPEAAARREMQRTLRRKHGWGYKKANVRMDERVDGPDRRR